MRKKWLIIALALVLAVATIPGAFAQEPTVIDGNTFANYQKTQQQIADRYTGIFEEAPGYEGLYEAPQANTSAGGLLTQAYLDKMLEGINYFRWLYGTPEIASITTNQELADFSLAQAWRLKEDVGLMHEPVTKPAGLTDMSDERWAEISGENALSFHNIIAGTNRFGSGSLTPESGNYGRGIKAWINEGKVTSVTEGQRVIGHREAVLDPIHNLASFGAASLVEAEGVGRRVVEAQSAFIKNDETTVPYEQDFYAMPAPGNFPYNELNFEDAAWTVYLNPDIFGEGQNTDAVIYVTNPEGERAQATNVSSEVQNPRHYPHTVTFEPTNVASFAPGEYKVEVENLTKDGAPVILKYTVVLFDRLNPAADTPSMPTVDSIEATPADLQVEKGTALDALKNNLTVTANLSDGTEKTVDGADYTLDGTYDGNTVGDYSLTVTYGEKTAPLAVHVTETQTPPTTKTLTAITLEPNTVTINAGDLPMDFFKVIATYSDDSTATYDGNYEGVAVTNFDTNAVGEQNATVLYTENGVTKEAALKVTVKPVFSGIVVDPNNLTVEKGTEVLPITVRGMYNGQPYDLEDPEKVVITGYDKDTPGEQQVIVSYKGIEAVINVTVKDKFVRTLTGISASLEKSQIEMYEDMPALTVKALYNDSSEEVLTADAYEVTGFDNTVADTQTITVTLKEDNTKTATVVLNVTEPVKKVSGLTLTLKEKTVPFGSNLADVLQIVAEYDDGTTRNLSVEDVTVSGYNPETAGNQKVTVTYNGVSAEIEIPVSERVTKLVDEATGVTLTAVGNGDLAGVTPVVSLKSQDSQTFKDMAAKLADTDKGSYTLANLYDVKLKKGDEFIAFNEKVTLSLPLSGNTPESISGMAYFPTDEAAIEVFNGTASADNYTATVDHLSLYGLIVKTNTEPEAPTLKKITVTVSGQSGDSVMVDIGKDLPELVVTAYYDNGTKKILNADDYTITPAYDKNTDKTQKLKITHEGKSATLTVARPKKSDSGTSGTQGDTPQNNKQTKTSLPKHITRAIRSGDTSPIIIVGVLLGLSLIGFVVVMVLRRKK